MQPEIVDAKPLPGYRVWVRFADGVCGEADLAHLVDKGVFSRWRLPGEFEQLRVDSEAATIVWPGGLDIAPDALYERITSQSPATAS